jgi:hypothetical protein
MHELLLRLYYLPDLILIDFHFIRKYQKIPFLILGIQNST